MSIKTEILTLQHIRFDLAFKIVEIEGVIDKAKKDVEVSEDIEATEWALEDLRQLYNETTHELQHNSVYRRAYPALCAIGMTDDEKAELLGNEVEPCEASEPEHGLAESDILDQMEKLKKWGEGYEDWSPEKLREKAIEILEDDIPF